MTAALRSASPWPSRLHQGDSLATSLLFLLALAVFQRFVGLLRNVLFCGLLNDDELGRWSLAFNFLFLAAPFVVLGIPGSFGRYVEHFRQRGQLRSFLRRTLLVTAGLTVLGAVAVYLAAPAMSQWLFDDPRQTPLMWALAAALAGVLVFNVTVELLTALRLVRMASAMQMISSSLFAVLSVGLLCGTTWREGAVIAAYGGSSLLAAAVGAWVVLHFWRTLPGHEPALASGDLWSKLLPFATWVWIGNLTANLFTASDQFMLKHFSGLDPVAADSLVGQYYSSRVVPLLLTSLTVMCGGSLLPHLIRDWEAGQREFVSLQINRAIKLTALAYTILGGLILWASPLLFKLVLRGKYDAGLEVLPVTLTYCIWFSVSGITHKYLLCAEQVRLGVASFAIGLVCNVALNLVLVPRYGLHGVVIATATAHALELTTAYWLSCKIGMRFDAGVFCACLLPATLMLGGWQSLAVAVLAGWLAWRADWLFIASEKRDLWDLSLSYWQVALHSLGWHRPVSTQG